MSSGPEGSGPLVVPSLTAVAIEMGQMKCPETKFTLEGRHFMIFRYKSLAWNKCITSLKQLHREVPAFTKPYMAILQLLTLKRTSDIQLCTQTVEPTQ